MLDGMKEMPARSFCDMECMIPDNVLSSLQTTCPVTQGHKHNLKNRFELKKTLGEGTYGKVKLAIERTSGRQVAIKYIKKTKIQDEHDLNRIRREIKIMSSLRHPHIVNVNEVFENRDKIILVMECANGGELYDYINNNRLTEKDARRIFRQIVSAIKYCHQNGIVHRDLKLENILLDQNDNAKIADFGLSNYYSHNDVLSTYCGSPLYASPEIVKGKPYHGPEVDCWSLGVVLYTLVYGTMPFDGTDFKKLRNQITNGDYYEPARPSEAAGLIRHLLTVNPAKRATITDIMSHWWVNLGHRVMPDNSPYVPPMVLQPVPCCHNQSLSSSSSESDDGENDSTKPKTVKPLKGILKKPKMIDSMSEVKCNDIKSSDAIIVVKENSNPLENQSGASNVFTETADDTVKNSDNDDSEFESQSRKSSDTSASDAVFVSDNVSNKTVFDSHKMPKRGILKRKGKFSTGDSGCDLNEGARLTSTSGATTSRPMDLSEGDSALESPDHFSVDDVLVKDKRDLVQSGAFNFGDEHDSVNRNNSSVVSGDSINTTVVPRRRGILKNASKDSDKRLSACSIGSNSSADILDFSYDSGDEGLSLAHYYRSESPKTSIVDYGSEIREVRLQGQASLADDIADMNEEKNVLQKALEICKNL